ncbi:MAG: HD domain-containing protein [Bacteroidales bacterium]
MRTGKTYKKIINDPVYGFITINSQLLFDLIEHPVFQRLRRIRQLGLTNFVYPGANHTRFQHALGAVYLMDQAINIIRSKGHPVTPEEEEAVKIAILLHDIGHGPFSHALEHSIISKLNHEILSEILMDYLNSQFDGRLLLAICIFRNKYKKKFLHQLVSSQLDMDRLDYLRRDSFFTGVTEGVIGSDRIIKMLNVVDDDLVIESKGIYSIEKFLIARRLMYWQVYLHKTVIAAEKILVNTLSRAKEMAAEGKELFCTPALGYFLYNDIDHEHLKNDQSPFPREKVIDNFIQLDDNDILTSAKIWSHHSDKALSYLSNGLTNRNLYKIVFRYEPFEADQVNSVKKIVQDQLGFDESTARYFVFTESISNNAYSAEDDKIKILFKDGAIYDIADASDMLNISVLSKVVRKYYLCYPKGTNINEIF